MAPKNRNPATKQETPLIESKSKNDDDDSKNIWSGTAFGRYQLLWYILSSMGLSYYFCHWFLGYDSKVRVFNHALAEVVILLGRWVNEYIYSKFGVEDILHHVVMIVGTGIVLFGPDVYKDRGYLVCHMEILHIPMMIWYLGCRRGALLESYPSAVSLSRTLFRPIWIFASIYRCTLMLGAAILAIKQSDAGGGGLLLPTIIITFATVLAYLDHGWGTYFFQTIGRPSRWVHITSSCLAVGAAIFAVYL